MKKTLFSLGLMMSLCTAGVFAQQVAPSCNNDNGLEGRINAIENTGWVEISREFQPIYYLVAPEPQYSIGTLTVVFGVDCPEGEACPKIARIYQEDAIQVSYKACVWQPTN
ncbi:MAG: hypothetical protein K0R65_1355 [Crocinitomicaceae bacterium]|nr:hypothetical protein [Crocinitomicaceae bacterium]